jgi:hypothetical protein
MWGRLSPLLVGQSVRLRGGWWWRRRRCVPRHGKGLVGLHDDSNIRRLEAALRRQEATETPAELRARRRVGSDSRVKTGKKSNIQIGDVNDSQDAHMKPTEARPGVITSLCFCFHGLVQAEHDLQVTHDVDVFDV